jgi:hypothetical protein
MRLTTCFSLAASVGQSPPERSLEAVDAGSFDSVHRLRQNVHAFFKKLSEGPRQTKPAVTATRPGE